MQNNHFQFNNYQIIQQIGKGTFGTILKAVKKNKNTLQKQQNQQKLAIKIQNLNTIKPLLHIEYELLQRLKEKQLSDQKSDKIGYSFTKVYQYQQTDYFTFMTMELLSITLQDYTNKQMKNKLSKDCLLRIFYNLLKIVENIHNLGYVHRDIKPANFMLKRSTQKGQIKYEPIIYPIDLGLAKKYINPLTSKHIIYKQNKKLSGTPIFCSLNTHKGIQQSRRDDIESLVYLIVYMVKKLPWQAAANKSNENNLNNKTEIYDEIYKIKKQTNFIKFLSDPQILPQSILLIHSYAINLSFEENPDYIFLYNLLEKNYQKLTKKNIQDQNCLCEWQDLTIPSIKEALNKQSSPQPEKKKIKINFKIPPSKLKPFP